LFQHVNFFLMCINKNQSKMLTRFSDATMIVKVLSLLALILPTVFIFGAGAVWPSSEEDGQCVKWRPEPWVYMTAWIFIAITSGLAWMLTTLRSGGKNPIKPMMYIGICGLFILLFSLTTVWQARYHAENGEGKQDSIGIFILIAIIAMMLLVVSYKVSPTVAALVSPIFIWSVVQIALSASELECVNAEPVPTVPTVPTGSLKQMRKTR